MKQLLQDYSKYHKSKNQTRTNQLTKKIRIYQSKCVFSSLKYKLVEDNYSVDIFDIISSMQHIFSEFIEQTMKQNQISKIQQKTSEEDIQNQLLILVIQLFDLTKCEINTGINLIKIHQCLKQSIYKYFNKIQENDQILMITLILLHILHHRQYKTIYEEYGKGMQIMIKIFKLNKDKHYFQKVQFQLFILYEKYTQVTPQLLKDKFSKRQVQTKINIKNEKVPKRFNQLFLFHDYLVQNDLNYLIETNRKNTDIVVFLMGYSKSRAKSQSLSQKSIEIINNCLDDVLNQSERYKQIENCYKDLLNKEQQIVIQKINQIFKKYFDYQTLELLYYLKLSLQNSTNILLNKDAPKKLKEIIANHIKSKSLNTNFIFLKQQERLNLSLVYYQIEDYQSVVGLYLYKDKYTLNAQFDLMYIKSRSCFDYRFNIKNIISILEKHQNQILNKQKCSSLVGIIKIIINKYSKEQYACSHIVLILFQKILKAFPPDINHFFQLYVIYIISSNTQSTEKNVIQKINMITQLFFKIQNFQISHKIISYLLNLIDQCQIIKKQVILNIFLFGLTQQSGYKLRLINKINKQFYERYYQTAKYNQKHKNQIFAQKLIQMIEYQENKKQITIEFDEQQIKQNKYPYFFDQKWTIKQIKTLRIQETLHGPVLIQVKICKDNIIKNKSIYIKTVKPNPNSTLEFTFTTLINDFNFSQQINKGKYRILHLTDKIYLIQKIDNTQDLKQLIKQNAIQNKNKINNQNTQLFDILFKGSINKFNVYGFKILYINFLKSFAFKNAFTYIFQLGDRHEGNVVVRQTQAHNIDFQAGFSLGMYLPFPQLVTFRFNRKYKQLINESLENFTKLFLRFIIHLRQQRNNIQLWILFKQQQLSFLDEILYFKGYKQRDQLKIVKKIIEQNSDPELLRLTI